MTDRLEPRDAKDVEEAVRWALAHSKALEIVGHGSKRAIGRPAQSDVTLDLSRLSGITLYEPEELVLSAKAGTPLAEIAALTAARGQMLAFEPMDCGAIFGGAPDRATIGGVLAANLAGPRRVKAGAARDHFLGFSAVSGRGEGFKSGGRVVKNVTGYDLCKLMAGSWGTLAIMTEVTIKVLPRPETEETLAILGLDDRGAVKAMGAAMASPCDVSGAAHLPAPVAQRIVGPASGNRSATVLRLEGVPASIAHRRRVLEGQLKPHGTVTMLNAADSRVLWQRIGDVTPFAADSGDQLLWRVSTAPAMGAELALKIAGETEAEFLYDWAGGLIWIALPPMDDAGAGVVRRAVAGCGGHATLIRAPAAVRAAVDVFEPQEPALAALTRRVKESFDPQGVLNPGRMWAGA